MLTPPPRPPSLLTTQKVLRAAQILGIPVVATTQKARRLGGIVPELQPLLEKLTVLEVDKTLFSMLTPEVLSHELFSPSSASASFTSAETSISTLSASSPPPPRDVVIVGIESHICVTQTVVDLLARGHRVRVLADGVSSCHPEEVPLALARLRADGAVVTSSESWLYETMGDADVPEFRDIARIVRESSANTKSSLAALLSSKI
ncbi:putative hydroxyethylthiazole kinase protein [Rosellinia necatrix]|uniref:Putative hydroxyethylthiazole kinase protein n=1 Tax=Rosellinia necatrix TaxID=77044 RepID=A0A1W2TNU9_ROSNE|nr:putative hydroxyethylthiazole kinase protein [Rosellinia necatrix]